MSTRITFKNPACTSLATYFLNPRISIGRYNFGHIPEVDGSRDIAFVDFLSDEWHRSGHGDQDLRDVEVYIDYELVSVDVCSSHHKQQPFISLNPFGQIPAMEDGEITLFKSRAINRYLARKYEAGTDLLLLRPNNLNGQAVFESWMEDEAHQFNPPMSIIIRETVIKPFLVLIPNERVVEEKAEKLGKVLNVYKERLGGDVYTMADLNHIPYVVYLKKSGKASLVISRPHVSAWWGKISARPGSIKLIEGMKLSP